MNNLHLALAVLGAVVLAAVVAHGAWTSRKNRPKQAEAGLQPASPVEPALDAQADGERREPVLDGLAPAPDEFGSLPAPRREAELDSLIDVIAPISIDTVVSGEAALAALPPTRRVGTKPFAVEGLSAETGLWEPPVAGQRYSAFQAGIQLANRIGAMNQIEYSEFVTKARHFADAVGGEPQFPEMLEEVARARELDQFAGEHDAQLSFTLRARNAAWSPGYVQQHAARLGFVAGVIPGRMVLPGAVDGQPPILGLSFDPQAALADEPDKTALREITLSLDVPQVDREDKPFERMCEAALSLATSMEGAITDDNGNAIRADTMETIHADLQKLYNTLQARDLPAGSALCRRLFS
ncbi:MAG: cell division protein ZipA C-terminal FtsZ-binding domain-containing protein [Betaproteobacteria bacterium]